MRLIGICAIRDEEDIVESFIRHNLVYLDKLYIIDNLSRDGTANILTALVNEGLDIEIWHSHSCTNQQDHAFTAALKKVAQQDSGADFAFLLDADEFLASPDRESLLADLQKIGPGDYGQMPWKTYIPAEDNLENLDPSIPVTLRMTHRRSQEGKQFFKAVVPKALFKRVDVAPGNHRIQRFDGRPCPEYPLSTALAHFPIRSADQLIAKAVLGDHTLRMKKDRRRNEGSHWTQLATLIRENNFHLTGDQIREYALSYAIQPGSAIPVGVLHDPLPVHPTVLVKYSNLANNSILHRFDQYIIRLCENNNISPVARSIFDKQGFQLIRSMRGAAKRCKRWIKRRLPFVRPPQKHFE